jgi:hypothetical protein
MTSETNSSISPEPPWRNKQYQGHTMQIIQSGNLFAIKHTYPDGRNGVLSMEDKERWYLIDLLMKCGWILWG